MATFGFSVYISWRGSEKRGREMEKIVNAAFLGGDEDDNGFSEDIDRRKVVDLRQKISEKMYKKIPIVDEFDDYKLFGDYEEDRTMFFYWEDNRNFAPDCFRPLFNFFKDIEFYAEYQQDYVSNEDIYIYMSELYKNGKEVKNTYVDFSPSSYEEEENEDEANYTYEDLKINSDKVSVVYSVESSISEILEEVLKEFPDLIVFQTYVYTDILSWIELKKEAYAGTEYFYAELKGGNKTTFTGDKSFKLAEYGGNIAALAAARNEGINNDMMPALYKWLGKELNTEETSCEYKDYYCYLTFYFKTQSEETVKFTEILKKKLSKVNEKKEFATARDAYYAHCKQGEKERSEWLIENNYDEDTENDLTAEELFATGRSLYYKNNYEEAIESFNKALDLEPDYTDAKEFLALTFWDLGGKCDKNGDLDGAIKAWCQYLSFYPDNAAALNNIAYSYFEKNDFDNAIKAINKAIKAAPDKANYWDTRAEIYEAMGEYKKAIADCKKALELDPVKKSSKEILERCQKAVKSAKPAPAAKKAETKKTAAKRPTAKKTETKKPAAKKPAAKKANG